MFLTLTEIYTNDSDEHVDAPILINTANVTAVETDSEGLSVISFAGSERLVHVRENLDQIILKLRG